MPAEFRLSGSHYLMLMRLDNVEERRFYEIEAAENNWSLRELQQQFDSALYEISCQSCLFYGLPIKSI